MLDDSTTTPPRLLYCRCAFAKVVPLSVKDRVLEDLSASQQPFEAVPDLCEMSARRDPALKRIAAEAGEAGGVRIAACYPRAVKWLFHAAGAPLPDEGVTILNMRTETAESVTEVLLRSTPIMEETT